MAQYWVTNAYQCIPLDNDVSFNQGALFFTNPLTALAFEDIVVNNQVKVVVITAAASQLGRMIIKLFQPHNIEIIAIVRKDDQANYLKENFKLAYVLNSADDDFLAQFSKLVDELSPSYMFEAISGSLSGKLISRMTKRSKIYLYGLLSKESLSDVDPMAFIGKGITVEGFYLTDWLEKK